MNKRLEIKWQPFNAIISGNKVIKELEEKRNKQIMPILSDDEKWTLESKIKKAYHTHEKIEVLYFWENQFFTKLGFINSIDTFHSKIYFQDNTSLYFEQLIEINFT